MSAVSLSEAWNEIPSTAPDPIQEHVKPVAARRVAPQVEEVDVEEFVPPPQPRLEVEPPVATAATLSEEMLQQMRSLRREESRRCTIYLCLSGILFAILFVYIDRLQQQVRLLNTFLLHRQLPPVVALPGTMRT